jgi:hypothetical protein
MLTQLYWGFVSPVQRRKSGEIFPANHKGRFRRWQPPPDGLIELRNYRKFTADSKVKF